MGQRLKGNCRLKRDGAVNQYTAEILTIWNQIYRIRHSFDTFLGQSKLKSGLRSPRLEKKQTDSSSVRSRDASGGRKG